MKKIFNVNGTYYKQEQYMVNLDKRLAQIKELADSEKYFGRHFAAARESQIFPAMIYKRPGSKASK